MEEKLHDTDVGSDFLNMTPKAAKKGKKLTNWTIRKLKTSVHQK